MEGSGSVQIITDPDLGGRLKTYAFDFFLFAGCGAGAAAADSAEAPAQTVAGAPGLGGPELLPGSSCGRSPPAPPPTAGRCRPLPRPLSQRLPLPRTQREQTGRPGHWLAAF